MIIPVKDVNCTKEGSSNASLVSQMLKHETYIFAISKFLVPSSPEKFSNGSPLTRKIKTQKYFSFSGTFLRCEVTRRNVRCT